jgi:hypothetical protein
MEEKQDVCTSTSPSLVPDRLRTALSHVDDADRCLDISAAAWRPVASDHWELARKLLAEARAEIAQALEPWARR